MLGEIFAVETAHELLDGETQILERIQERGIIAVSEWWPSSLPDAESTHPLFVFTHSLLHAHLLRSGRTEYRKLLEILGAGLPLYSIVPIQLLQSARTLPLDELALPLVDAAIARLNTIADKLNEGADWENALGVWSVGEMLFRQSESRWAPDDRRRILSSLYDVRLYFFQRGAYSEEYESWVDRFQALTETVDSFEEAKQRLSALLHRQDLEFRKTRSGSLENFREVDLLTMRFPALQRDPIFSDYLQQTARISWVLNSAGLARQVEQYVEQIAVTMAGSPEIVAKIRRKVGIYLLTWFNTPEELQQRLSMLAELESSDGEKNLDVAMQKIELYFRIGRLSDIRDAFPDVITRCHRNGLFRFESRYRFQQAMTRFALEGSIAELERSIDAIFSDTPVALSREFRWYVTNGLAHFALLHNELAWGTKIVERFSDLTGTLLYKSRILIPLAADDPEALARLEGLNRADAIARDAAPLAQRMVAVLLGKGRDVGLFRELEDRIAEPLLTFGRAVDVRLIVELADRMSAQLAPELACKAASIVRAGIGVLLPWLAERSYLPALHATVERFGRFLDSDALEMWSAKVAALQARHAAERTLEDARVRISMLGTILVNRPGEAPHRLRGSRLSILLGLMVADRMLGRSLAPNEFRRLAFQVNDPEYGRKMVNGAVWRLREIIGHDTVRTDGETPHLDLERVEVDLLEANTLLERARDAVRSGALMRAVPPLLAALRISRGEVPFPGLYEDFFEAARDDFETKLRRTVIDVATALLQEEDAARAEEVLRRASETIPGDEDFGALLHQALIALGRRAEAEVLKAERK
jgi:DNA-binding SARP family transcriptional activator